MDDEQVLKMEIDVDNDVRETRPICIRFSGDVHMHISLLCQEAAHFLTKADATKLHGLLGQALQTLKE